MVSLSDQRVFLFVFTFRLINALSIATFFQPDEFFQSLEPALAMLGYNGWVTWEWQEGLRSIAHPLIFGAVYKLVELCSNALNLGRESKAELMTVGPKTVQALFAVAGDLYTYKLARRIYGQTAGDDALLLSIGSAFHWFCSTRTFTNSLETSITAAALYYWPWEDDQAPNKKAEEGKAPKNTTQQQQQQQLIHSQKGNSITVSLFLAAVATVFRPTNVIVWCFLGGFLVLRVRTMKERLILLLQAIVIGSAVTGLTLYADYWYYGELVFPPYQFLRFNVVQSLSHFYGVNPWHYYISQGIPLLLISYMPLALYAVYLSLVRETWPSASKQLSLMIVGLVPIFSFIGHKEMRFIYPLLPALHCLTAGTGLPNMPPNWRRQSRRTIFGLIAINLPVALYLTQVHQRGVMDVTNWLRQDDLSTNTTTMLPSSARRNRVGFLMPCHSTPWYSHLQGAVDVRDPITGRIIDKAGWALTCEPPLGLSEEERLNYLDEADQFYLNQTQFLLTNFPQAPMKGISINDSEASRGTTRYEWPQKLVAFEAAENLLKEFLKVDNGGRYEECKRFFNSHFHDDHRRRGDVVVWCMDMQ